MSKLTATRPASKRMKHTSSRPAQAGGKASPALGALQAKADDSTPVTQLRQVQSRASTVVQREVDTSSSPFLPDYGPDETPAWDTSSSVPEWAEEEYKEESKVKLIASVKDGLIGSIYFANGRIRTTHGHGPELSKHDPKKTTTHQFNIDIKVAYKLFSDRNRGLFKLLYDATDPKKGDEERRTEASDQYRRTRKLWLSNYLINTPVDKLPDWVTPVPSHESAFDTEAADPPDNLTLFEVFKRVSNGKVQGWHPSRGIAAKFETNKQVVSVLKAAILHIHGVTDTNERNTKFYDFIKKRLPDFAKQIRRPDQV
ncbi:hypothetical protein [Roseobacter sp.]|uniref:hypothetical protein n=1 Tax=Roseobacter sp. TaxID=1907202 RepID=UPI0029672A24|nr:hypothetical protein [Roseobacter sp.]